MMLWGLGVESQGKHQLMLMMLGGLGLKARASTADAHDARAFGPGQHQLMLMMLGPALMLMNAHDARGFGCG